MFGVRSISLTAVPGLPEPLLLLQPWLCPWLWFAFRSGQLLAWAARAGAVLDVPAVGLLVAQPLLWWLSLCPSPELPQRWQEGKEGPKAPWEPLWQSTWPGAVVVIPEGSRVFLLCLQGVLPGAELPLQLHRARAGPFCSCG